jgi:Protein of unknown function (DUF1573)
MSRQSMRLAAAALSLVLVGTGSSTASTADWAKGLFTENGHDFGPVPRGSKVRHNFVLTNRQNDAITILDVRASCGCTTGRANATIVPPGSSAVVEAEMDTRNFVGRKETTLFVSVVNSRGQDGEVRLAVSSTILSDIVLNPGSFDFGVVGRGQTPKLVLTIDRLGSPDWRIARMVSTSKALSASLQETARSASGVSYALTVSLKSDTPAGQLRDEIRLLTNDRESRTIPVLVTALVRGELTASPAALSLGNVASTGGAQGRYIIRGTKPFAIASIDGVGDGFNLAPSDREKKTIHVLTLTFRPEESAIRGDLRRAFRVHTDLADEPPIELSATLHYLP